jgi:hypothetical protein
MTRDTSVHLTLRISDELSKEIDSQMDILGYVRKTDYVRAAIKEKVEREKEILESGTKYYVKEAPPKYMTQDYIDSEIKRALMSNKDIQTIICDLVEKNQKKEK